MQTEIWEDEASVDMALERLGVPRSVLQDAVKAGHLSRITRTGNDAPSAAGYYQWNDTLRSLRDGMVPHGWKRSDLANFSTAVHPENNLAIAVSSGDQNTGLSNKTPSTKRAKGPRTAQAVDTNQGWIPGLEPETETADDDAKYPTWILLFFSGVDVLRAELSLPVKLGSDGHVSGWRERIILPPFSFDPSAVVPEPDFGPDIDIQITKKK